MIFIKLLLELGCVTCTVQRHLQTWAKARIETREEALGVNAGWTRALVLVSLDSRKQTEGRDAGRLQTKQGRWQRPDLATGTALRMTEAGRDGQVATARQAKAAALGGI